MKKKIKVIIKNVTENQINKIETFGIKTNNKIIFKEKNIKNIIKYDKNIILIRENNEFLNTLYFIPRKETISEYILKDNDFKLEINIYTKFINITNQLIEISYKVIDSNIEYEYRIEVKE